MLITQPNIIEQSTFTGGWSPDGIDAVKDSSALIDLSNLLLDRTRVTAITPTGLVHEVSSGGMVTRKGFRRLRAALVGGGTYYIRDVHPFRHMASTTNYLMCIVSTGASAANNVQVWAVKLSDLTAARVDTAGRTWTHYNDSHWGIGIDDIYYGGVQGEKMYSWNPTGNVWTSDASTNTSWKTWVDAQDDSVTTSTQFGRDYAFKGKEVVTYSGHQYTPNKSIRYDQWNNDAGTHYSVDDKVSRRQMWASTSAYWKSFKCIQAHNSDVITTAAPGTGADWKTYWHKIRLPIPMEDSTTSAAWNFVPTAAKTNVAEWHMDKLFMRYDDQGDKSRLLYSATVQYDKGQDVPDVTWDPTDFTPTSNFNTKGGGWRAFNDGKHTGVISALQSYNTYLLVFKRRSTWVLAGEDDSTWNSRRLIEGVGCVGPNAKVIHDGAVYFLSDDGLYETDGTTVQEVPGNGKLQQYLKSRMDTSLPSKPQNEPCMWSWEGKVWFSIPDTSVTAKYVTIAYDPSTSSFWKTDMPVQCAAAYRDEGVSKLVFGAPLAYGSSLDIPYQYDHASAADADDAGGTNYSATAIAWNARFAWWPFGTMRQERRIRNVWAVVKGSLTYTLKARVNWSDTVVKTTTRVVGENEIQTLLPTAGAAGDTFKLTFNAHESTTAITIPTGGYKYITAAQVKTALLAISDWNAQTANIAVAGEYPEGFTIQFSGSLGAQDIGPITVTSATGAAAATVTETRKGAAITTPMHIEGEWFKDCHAVNFELSSTAAPATVLGIAVNTQPRRVGYADR